MFAMAKLMEMDSTEQNKVALYLFNSINKFNLLKNYVNCDKIVIVIIPSYANYNKNSR